ncbi:DUF2510 domain-containing protein [Nocardioides sp. BGMRC 2183]|nr:DUF2510 domain-containing protein [Nocardioides sp. BGMRC 2183]
MTNAGWYPDPAGAPDTYRYWDGQSWSEHTSSNPYGGAQQAPQQPPQQPPPPPAAPPSSPPGQPTPPGASGSSYGALGPTPGSYGSGGYGSGGYGSGGYGPGGPWSPEPPGGSGGSTGKTVGIVLGAVAALVVLALIAFFAVRAVAGGDDDTTAGDDTSSEDSASTDGDEEESEDTSPSEGSSDPSAPSVGTCTSGQPVSSRPNKGETITGGRLTMPSLKDEGYTIDHSYATAFTFAERMSTINRTIETSDDGLYGWVSIGGVGGLRKNIGVESMEQATQLVMACMANNPELYSGFTGMTELESKAMKVDGHDAYSLIAELRVDDARIKAEGDQVQVVVVDTGHDRLYGLYIYAVPIGDDKLIALQEQTIGKVTVND